MKNYFNKTKIIATIGPASKDRKSLEKMMRAGMDVCRINASHGDKKMSKEIIDSVRSLNKDKNSHIAILFDLQGPKIRIGDIKEGTVLLKEKEEIILTHEEVQGDNKKVFIKYPFFHKDVMIGDSVLIDDGKLELLVTEIKAHGDVVAKVVHGGPLSSRKGVNLPHTKISLPSLTEKDLEDLDFALENDVEWIGLSFVRSPEDIIELKKIIADRNKKAKVIAKMEKPEAIKKIDRILEVTDGVMVARGDLGVEMPMEQIPLIQKMIVKKCRALSKPVIIATQMMESMITNFRPTRAETNDVANAVFDGADALMLSGETSVGNYPVEVVKAMSNIIHVAEYEEEIYYRGVAPISSDAFVSDSVCYNACTIAKQSGAKAIAAMTHSGYTGIKISSQRPKASIFVFTDNKPVLNMLNLVWGIRGFFYNKYESTDNTIRDIKEKLKKEKLVEKGDLIIHVASTPIQEKSMANTIKLNPVD